METTNSNETRSVLREWRTRILNGFLVFTAAACVPVVGMTFVAATKRPEQWPAVALFTILLLLLAVLAFWRGLNFPVRAAGLLLLGYVAAILSLARGGLAGSGRDYLVVLPIVALILAGVRVGVLLSAFSALILAIFAVLADRGLLLPWLVNTQNPLRLADWAIEGGTTLALLAIAMVLLVLFHRFQVQVMDRERRARTELVEAQALLEEQNRTLEERILERTAELAQATRETQREKLYSEAVIQYSPVAIVTTDPAANVFTWNPAAERLFGFTAAEASGRNLDEMVVNHPAIQAIKADDVVYGPEVTAQAPIHAITQRTRRDGTLVDVEVWAVRVVVPGEGVRVLALYHDLTEIKRAEEALQESHRQLQIINRVQEGLAYRLGFQGIIDLIGEKLGEVFAADTTSVAMYDEERDWLSNLYYVDRGRPIPWPDQPTSRPSLGAVVMDSRKPLLIGTKEECVKLGSLLVPPPGEEEDKNESYMGVPILAEDKVIGLITIQSYQQNAYSQDDIRLLQTLANSMSIALENARLLDETQEARAAAEQANMEMKQAQQALQESHRQLADIVNFMPDAVLVIDHEGKIIAWNRAMEEMTGTKAENMLGKGNYEYAVPFYGERRPILIDLVTAPRKEMEEKYSEIRKEGPVLVGETYVPQLRGGGHYLLGTASALHDSKGEVVGAIEVIRDFTERKHMEEALRQAKEAAEAATQAKSAFLATMSHEIRTPMNAVIGMTGLLLDTPLTPEQREFAETIRTSGDALLTIINDVLDFSKIEARRMELESQPFDLRECVESAMDLLAPSATEKGLNLGCVVESDVPAAIVGDATRLRQVLVNLLSNAVKFTEEGEVVVTLECRGEVTSPLQELHFSVRDTGIGIPPELMGRLFQSFSQVDASTTRRFGGTGLGLAISQHLTELMGGTMWVESPAASSLPVGGPGSAFHFTVRAEVAPAPTARAYAQGIQPWLEGRRALIVDDNPTNRRILSLQTQAWGMHSHQTGSPAEALEWLRRGDSFDVAFLDLQMPDMDGVALAGQIRQLREASALPLVMLSSLGSREAETEEGDWTAFLLKPIKASQLYNVLVGIFDSEAGEVAVPQAPGKPQFDAGMGERHPLRILLAEDNLVNQKLALRLLERMGYRADVAANGLEVLESLRRQPYDVVLMDVQMPEMDGLEASRAIWGEWPAEQRPRIVAMTANVMPEDRQECLAAGMDDFIAKPIRVDELVAVLGRSRPLTGRASPVPASAPGESITDSTGHSSLLDPAALERLREMAGGGAGFLREMFETILADAPGMLAEMHHSLAQGDAATLRRAAHSLKSNSADFGANALSELCRELEMMGKAGTLEGAAEKLAAVEAEWAQVRAALERQQREEGGQ